MVQQLQAKDVTLVYLAKAFGLERMVDRAAFPEWHEALSALSEAEQQAVEDIKQEYLHLSQYDLLEPVVKLVVLSPLLKLAGFYRPPYYIDADAEKTIELRSEGGTRSV